MTDTIITVQGEYSAWYPAERATVSASVHADGPKRDAVFARAVEASDALRGAELVGIALSNPQPGRPRLAYIAARIYDETYAAATASRPPFDIGGALLVVELDEGVAVLGENEAGCPLRLQGDDRNQRLLAKQRCDHLDEGAGHGTDRAGIQWQAHFVT